MMGIDYAFGKKNPVKFIRGAKKISKAAQDAILGANAAKFLGNDGKYDSRGRAY